MTTKEIFYYVKLMCLIKNKNKGVYLYGKNKSKFKKGICGSI